jgi:outer membrane protein assembly factor BamE (lipoprotein component of BamABCDE complex)
LFVDGSFLGPLLTGSLLQVGCVYALGAAGLERGAAFDSESVAAIEEGMTEADVLRLLGEPNDQSKAHRDVAWH